jgi:hypothetical protein
LASVSDGGKIWDGFMNSNYGNVYINWYKFDKNWNQIPIGGFVGTVSADGKTLNGTVTKGTASGPCTLNMR